MLYDLISRVKWNFLEVFDDVEDACTYFYGKLNRCVPTYTTKHKIMDFRLNAKYHSLFKKINNLDADTEFSRLRAKDKTDISRLYCEYVKYGELNIN